MTAYAIFIKQKTHDQADLKKYGDMAAPTVKAHPITPLAFFGAYETIEGEAVEGAVILSFPSMDAAKAWYYSPEYQAAAAQRHASADFQVIFVEGVA